MAVGCRGENAEKEKLLFEETDVRTAVLRLAGPTVAGQVILVLYNMADTFFVGLTGNDATLTAVAVCMPAFLFLSAIANLFGVGGASVIARALGSGDQNRGQAAAAFAFWGCLLGTGLYSLLALLFRDPFIDLLGGTNPAVHSGAAAYLVCTVAAGGLFASLSVCLSHLVRAEGRAFHASVGIALGGVLNILLDPLFMFRLLPRGNEALGAAAATTVSNAVSCLYFALLLFRLRGKTLLRFRFSRLCLQRELVGDLLSAGLPACVMTLLENVSYAVLDKLMSLAGLPMQAGIGVAKKLNMLAHSIVRGIAQGAMPLIAYNFASGRRARMEASFRFARRFAVATASLCMLLSLCLAGPLTGIFLRGASASRGYGIAFLRILCLGGPFSASAYTCISFFQATGEGGKAFLLAILRKGLVDIPLMFLLQGFLPVYGFVLATPAADLLCCLIAARFFSTYLKTQVSRGTLAAPAA